MHIPLPVNYDKLPTTSSIKPNEQFFQAQERVQKTQPTGKFSFEGYRRSYKIAPSIAENIIETEKNSGPNMDDIIVSSDKIDIVFSQNSTQNDKKVMVANLTQTLNERFSPYVSFARKQIGDSFIITYKGGDFKDGNISIDPYFQIALEGKIKDIQNSVTQEDEPDNSFRPEGEVITPNAAKNVKPTSTKISLLRRTWNNFFGKKA
jgi:hypothetical protein